MAAGAGNEKKRKKRNFSPAPGLNPGRQLRWSSDLPERPAFQAKIPKSIVRLIMLPANIYCERRLGSHDWSRSHAFATAAMSSYTFSLPIPSAASGDSSTSATFLAGPFARIPRDVVDALALSASSSTGQNNTHASTTFAAWNRDLSRPGMPLDNLMRTTIAGLRVYSVMSLRP